MRVAGSFVGWYNDDHQRSAIRFVTPSQHHGGHDVAILAHRAAVYCAARRRNPIRWSRSASTATATPTNDHRNACTSPSYRDSSERRCPSGLDTMDR
jgi:hypothetical protein